MKASSGFDLRARGRSFVHAFRGLRDLIAIEHNAWIHAAATLLVIVFAVALRVSAGEAVALTLCVALVWVAEAFNTAVEALGDAITDDADERLRRAKDVAAAGVLMAAAGSVIVGLWIFAPKLLRLVVG